MSEDERAQDQGADGDVWDPLKSKGFACTAAEPVLHSIVDQPTTSYLNVLLNAKNQGQPIVICRGDGQISHPVMWAFFSPKLQYKVLSPVGPTADGEGFKSRSEEMLMPLQLQLLDPHMCVVPGIAALDAAPMPTLPALADTAAAIALLQKQVGPFVDSLSDGAFTWCFFAVNDRVNTLLEHLIMSTDWLSLQIWRDRNQQWLMQ